uniref:Uncharacterized protein n=1 Tax=Musa acuminata subsp. malaccensis TaxID=214687 RepID=A0A804JE01_MUSAM
MCLSHYQQDYVILLRIDNLLQPKPLRIRERERERERERDRNGIAIYSLSWE